ncbi:hypothetical protein GPJ56_003206 [Histomonas meleagridis]|uniref:uncharacterized protein n=1 Tax=Histomonas meleagridis TaxID=135588 RepID=UPI0035595345|nr:hypothetical protein GPJ56_003206 [Histomonas meleagridis]KAH0801239.1 hypothetical protein GO595_005834 [Histomonas meleagridis]
MRALYQYQQEEYKKKWYKAHKENPPNLRRKEKTTNSLNNLSFRKTEILEGFQAKNACDPKNLCYSYWDTEIPGIEPLEFRASVNSLRSDSIISNKEISYPGNGVLNNCFTPYENDIMSFGAFETTRLELKRKALHLSEEMKRVDEEFYRPPKENWFCLKGPEFTSEHIRHNKARRREAQVINGIGTDSF